jgi:PKD repeat protein
MQRRPFVPLALLVIFSLLFTWPAAAQAPSTPNLPPSPQAAMDIYAAQGWQQTPLSLQQGEQYAVWYESGDWTVDYRSLPYVDASGYSPQVDSQISSGCKVVSSETYATLLGRVGSGAIFAVGSGGTFTANTAGPLYLRINDQDACLGDNDGFVNVTADSLGAIDLEVTSIQSPAPPICAGTAPEFQAVIRNNGSTASGSFNIRWLADSQTFDGGHTSIAPGATDLHGHIWSSSISQGQHSVTFIADYDHLIAESNENNNQKTVTFTAQNCAPSPPTASFTAAPLSGNAPLAVTFNNTSTGDITSCAWNYGDGATGTSCAASHSHRYANPGTYTVGLTVAGPGGSNTKTRTSYISVSTPPPVKYSISGRVANSANNAISGVTISDGAGHSATTNSNGNYTLSGLAAGTYTLTAAKSGYTFAPASLQTTVPPNATAKSFVGTPVPAAPVANFTASRLTGPAPLTVNFTDTSTGNPTSWAWDFDNNGTTDSTQQSPSYTYTTAGTYSVKLTVTGSGGTDAEIKNNYIAASASFPSVSSLCGQLRWATSSNTLVPVFVSNSAPVARWAPAGFLLDAYYRINNPQANTLNPPIPTQEYGLVQYEIAAWSSYQQVDPSVCGTPPPPPGGPADLIVSNITFNPTTPEAFQNFSLTITVMNTGSGRYDPGDGNYKVEVTLVSNLGNQWSLFFNSEDPSSISRLSPGKLRTLDARSGTMEVTISNLVFPSSITNGAVEVHLIPKNNDTNLDNNRHTSTLNITGWPIFGAIQCIGTCSFAIDGGVLAGAKNGWIKTVTKEYITSEVIDNTKDVYICANNNDWQDCAKRKWRSVLDLVPPEKVPDVVAEIIKMVFGFVEDIIGCTLEVTRFLFEYVGSLSPRGVELNAVAGESPIYILVSNSKGQRLGFLDDGTPIQEIAGAQIIQHGSLKFLLYPGTDTAQVSVKGIGSGTFDLLFTLSKGSTATKVEYLNVPTSSTMVGKVDANNEQYLMFIDQNGDGTIDSTRTPDDVTTIRPQRLYLPLIGR